MTRDGTASILDPSSAETQAVTFSHIIMFFKTLQIDTPYLALSCVWWRHQIETFSALLPICAGNSLVPREFPAQRPVKRSFDVFIDLCLNKRLSKQSWGWWFETLSRHLWRRCNELWDVCYELTWLRIGCIFWINSLYPWSDGTAIFSADMCSAKSGYQCYLIGFLPIRKAIWANGQKGKWPWCYTTTGLDNSIELRTEKSVQLFQRYAFQSLAARWLGLTTHLQHRWLRGKENYWNLRLFQDLKIYDQK